MSQEKTTIKDLQEQLKETRAHRIKTLKIIKDREEKLAEIIAQEKKGGKTEPVSIITDTRKTTISHDSPETISVPKKTESTKDEIASSSETKKHSSEKDKKAQEFQLQNVHIALDATKNEMEKISEILTRGFDSCAVSGKDLDSDVAFMLFRHMQKGGNFIGVGEKVNIGYNKTITELPDKPKTWLELDRGGTSGSHLSVDKKGNVILTIDHHELGGHIEPTSTTESLYLLLKKLDYKVRPFNIPDTKGKNNVLIREEDIENFIRLVNAQDNLTYTYSLEDLQTVYPASLVGIMHLLSPEDTLRLLVLHGGDPYTEFTEEEKKMLIREKKQTILLSETITRQTEYVKNAVNAFETSEKKSVDTWGTQSDMFGKTLLLTGKYSIASHIAYSKKYETIILLNTNTKELKVFSRINNLDVAYERIHQKIPSAIFPRGIIVVPPGQNTLNEQELADIFGLSKEKIPDEEKLLYAPGDASLSRNDADTNHAFPNMAKPQYTAEAQKEQLKPESFLDLPPVKKTVKERRKEREEIESQKNK